MFDEEANRASERFMRRVAGDEVQEVGWEMADHVGLLGCL